MQVRISGKAKKLEHAECRRALALWSKYLFGTRLDKVINLTLKFDPKLIKGSLYAYMCDVDDETPSRKFRIYVSPNLSRKDTLNAIAHEMVHVRQNAKGTLKSQFNNTVKWQGKLYECDESSALGYWLVPWEVEARGLESGLYALHEENERSRKK